jgi:hypothetical protein
MSLYGLKRSMLMAGDAPDIAYEEVRAVSLPAAGVGSRERHEI